MKPQLAEAVGVGSSPLRTEDVRLLTGKAKYVENIDMPDCLVAVFVRSPHAHARIVDIDTSVARKCKDVVGILTGKDLLDDGVEALPYPDVVPSDDGSPMRPPRRFALAVDRVRFSGEAVALVVAKSQVAALDASEQVVVEYEPLKAVVNALAAYGENAPRIKDDVPRNVVGMFRMGNAAETDAAFANAAHVTRVLLRNQRISASPMETRGAIAAWDKERLTLYVGNQAPHMMRDQIAAVLGVPIAQVRIVVGDIGGGFGMKLTLYPEEVALLHAARKLKARIRWKAQRMESFLSDMHGRDHETDAEMAFDGDGRILGMRLRVWANMGAYLTFFGTAIATVTGNRVVSSVYRIPALSLEVYAMLTNTAPIGPYRGAGRPEAIYRIERLLDVAAKEMALDPVALRKVNLVTPDEIPYATPSGQVYESGNFPKILERALALGDWSNFPTRCEQAEARGLLYGHGICCHIDTTSGVKPSERVRLVANPDGGIVLFSGTQAMGQGLATVYASMVATRMNIPIERVEIVQGDTDRVASGVGSYGSRSLFIGGSAVVFAVEALLSALGERAAEQLGSNSGDICFRTADFS